MMVTEPVKLLTLPLVPSPPNRAEKRLGSCRVGKLSAHKFRAGVAIGYVLLVYSPALRADPVVELVTENGVTASAAADEDRAQWRRPVLISVAIRTGYDDNFRTAPVPSGLWFTEEQLTLAYDRRDDRTEFSILAGAGVIERYGQQPDENASLVGSLNHHFTERLSLQANMDAAYRADPDFSANVGPTRRAGNYFRMVDQLSLTYQWSRRVSTVSSYSLGLIRYENAAVASFTDREEHTFGEEFRFEVFPTTVLTADYRFLVVDFFALARDSTTHYATFGVEHSFSQRLQAKVRMGASFRAFERGGESVDPDFEGSVDYLLNRKSSVAWSIRYSVEQATTPESFSQTTFRTGLQFRYEVTPRVSSAIGFNYHHDENQPLGSSGGTESISSVNAYELLLNVHYQINRFIALDLGFARSETNSDDPTQDYTRNRYSIGLSFTF